MSHGKQSTEWPSVKKANVRYLKIIMVEEMGYFIQTVNCYFLRSLVASEQLFFLEYV